MNKNTITLTDEQLKAFNSGEDVVLKAPQKKPELFKPSDGYYFVNGCGAAVSTSVAIFYPALRMDFFNCFQSLEVAEKAAIRMRRANAVISACLAVDPDINPEECPAGHRFWAPCYSSTECKWVAIYDPGTSQASALVSTFEKAQQAADILNSLDLPS